MLYVLHSTVLNCYLYLHVFSRGVINPERFQYSDCTTVFSGLVGGVMTSEGGGSGKGRLPSSDPSTPIEASKLE